MRPSGDFVVPRRLTQCGFATLVLRTSRISTPYGQFNKTNLSEVMSKREILNRNALGQFAPNKQTITLNAIQKEVIVGTLLGDASMPLYRGKPKLHVKFGQCIARAEYIWHLYYIFENPVGRLCRHTPARAKPAWRWRSGL